MDGAFISNNQVINGENPTGENKPYYAENSIITTNVDRIIERNERKKRNLNYLMSISQIQVKSKRPSYSVFFFSCNLDHFLHGNANMSVREKAVRADEYASKYESDPIGFVSSIKSNTGALVGFSYSESWNYIKDGKHSLESHSNINILLDRLINESNK